MPSTFDPSTILKPTAIKPYPYQEAGVRKIVGEFKRGIRSTLAVYPTGCGKTAIGGWVSRWALSKSKRVLVLAHRDMLIQQFANSLTELGVPVAIEQGAQHARVDSSWITPVFSDESPGEPVCVVASKDSMQKARLESWPKDYFGMIIIDEGHHATANTYRKILKYFDFDWLLLLTATPDRMDGQCLGLVAETVADQYPIRQAIADGWLCRPKFHKCDVEVDLRQFTKRKMGDYSDDDIALAIQPHLEEIINATKQEIGDRRTIVFCPDVLTAELFASALNSETIGISAEAVSYRNKPADRKRIIDGYRNNEFQVLCNAMLLTEGFDVPATAAVVLCRPTMSRALMSQMIGRGMRRGKPDVLIIDFCWVTDQHDVLPVNPVELFDEFDLDSEIIENAKKKVEDGETDDLLEAVERAEAEHAERVRVKIEVRERRVRYERIVYDPFAVMEAVGMPIRQEAPSSTAVRATARQAELLTRMGVVGAEGMSKRRASAMLEKLFARREQGLATFKQISHLTAQGMDPKEARKLTKDEATERLGELFGKTRVG